MAMKSLKVHTRHEGRKRDRTDAALAESSRSRLTSAPLISAYARVVFILHATPIPFNGVQVVKRTTPEAKLRAITLRFLRAARKTRRQDANRLREGRGFTSYQLAAWSLLLRQLFHEGRLMGAFRKLIAR